MRFSVSLPGNTRRLYKNFSMNLLEFVINVKNRLKVLHSSSKKRESMGMRGCSFLAMIINSKVLEIDEDKFWKSLKFKGL